jgi:hypothetical protein
MNVRRNNLRHHPEVRAGFGEPRRMAARTLLSFEARKSAHLRMTALACGQNGMTEKHEC